MAISPKGILDVLLRVKGIHNDPETSVPVLFHDAVSRNSRSPVVWEAKVYVLQNKMGCASAQARSAAHSLRCRLDIGSSLTQDQFVQKKHGYSGPRHEGLSH